MKTNCILSRSISSLLFLNVFAGATAKLFATSDAWDGSTDAMWATNTNWLTNPAIVPGTGDTATFNGPGNGFTSINLGGGVTINTILFDLASAAAYTIGSGPAGSQTLTLDNGGSIMVTSSVTNSQLINAALILGNDGSAQPFNLVNQSTVAGQLLTIAGGVTGSTGAGEKALTISGAGNVLISGIIANGTTGTVSLTKNDAGTLTLSAVNTYTGGTSLNGGTLNVNNAGALGNTAAGPLVITGGILDNTSGAAITTSPAKAMNWNGDFTFTGTNNLSTNLGAVTIGGAAGSRTVTVSNGVLATGVWTAAAGIGLTKAGPGTLFMANTANTSNIGGPLDIQAGKVQVAGDLTMGGLTGTGTIENGGAASKWIFVNTAVDNAFSGTIQGNPAVAGARLGLVKRGVGTLHLTGSNNTYADNFAIENGAVRLTGINNVGGTNLGQVNVGNIANQSGVLFLDGGTLNASKTNAPSLSIGTVGNSRGIVTIPAGTINSTSEMWVGSAGGAYGALTMSGGTVSVGNWLAVGRNGNGVVNMSGGTLNVTGQNYTNGSFTGALGVTNLSGGTINVTSLAGNQGGFLVAEAGGGILNMSGTGALNISGARGLHLAINGGTGIVNLGGGTITTPMVQNGTSTGTFNFHGGTLRPSSSNANFMSGVTNAYIYSEGGTVDTNGNEIAIAQPLLAPTGSGVNAVPVATGGAGYLATPIVTLSGGSGTGATAIANVSGGSVTGFTITNPGTGYLAGDVITATLFGGGATTPATAGTITVAANSGGGLTKTGLGTLTLSSANTYSGATTINAGTLLLDVTGSVNGSTGISINGNGAKLVHTGADAISPAVTLTNGVLDGTGTVNSVIVGDGTGGVITHGNGTTAMLTIGSLTFNGAATLNLRTGATTPELIKTTTLVTGATNPAGLITINAAHTNSVWTNGIYSLISYTTLGGSGFGNLAIGSIAGLGARQNAALNNSPGLITLTIGGDLPIWTGLQNGNWTTSTVPDPKNWRLQTAGTPTDFINGDTVLFNDTATGTTALNISDGNVNTTSTTFDNSTLNYTISSTGGFGVASGSLLKNGTGRLTINTGNSHAGGTTLNNGVLNLNHPGALGTGSLTINAGSIDNTSGAAIVLANNNAQIWNGDFTFEGTNDLNLGTGAITLSANRVITTNGTAALTIGGTIGGGAVGFGKGGSGALVLGGASTYTGPTTVSAGRIRVTGTINAANAANIGQINVGDLGQDNAILEIAGGTINATKSAAPSLLIANIAGGSATARLTAGTINSTSEMWVGSAGGAYGALTMSGGTVSVGNWLAVGRNGNGVVNMSGGTLNVTGQNYTNGSFTGALGVTNLSGGTINVTSLAGNQGGFLVAEAGGGILNMSGTGALNISGARGLHLAINGGTGIVNLGGGTITTPMVQNGASTGTFNFHGGTLRPSNSNANFMSGVSNAYIYSGGTVDTNGNEITIAQPLLAPTGSGISATGLTVSGSGFIDTPLIVINGAGTGATAVANLDANGNLTGITITNPGTDYTSDPVVFEILGGGGTGTIAGTPALVANTSGGLTKSGAGTLTLSGANTYGGTTNINAGTLRVSNTSGSATGTGTVNINSGGTFSGTGTITGTANITAGGILSPGDAGVGTISVGGLTLNPGGLLTYEWDVAQNNDRITVTGNNGLTINGGTLNLYNAGGTTVFGSNGVYNLISYAGNISGNPTNLNVDPASRLAGKDYTFGTNNGFVTLLVTASGVTANFWNVNSDGAWTTAANWTLNSAPNAPQAFANFGGGGTPITAPRTVTLDANQTVGSIGFNSPQPFTITGASTLTLDNGSDAATISVTSGSHTLGVAMNAVSAGVQFNVTNSADVLTVSGPLSGTANVTKIGPGTVTFSAANSYAGTNTLNFGNVTISGSGTLGNTANPLSIVNGTLNFGGTVQTVGATTMSGGTIANGTLTPSSLTSEGAGSATISARIAGSTSVTKNGTGTLTLSGNNSYTGATTVNAGTVVITDSNSLGASTSSVTFTGGALSVEGTAVSDLGSRVVTGFPALINVSEEGHTFSISQSFDSVIAFVKRGLGRLALSGTNTFAAPGAPIAVNAGVLNIAGGITSDIAPGNQPIQIANEAGATATLTVSGAGTLNTGTSEIFVGQGFATANGVLNLQDSGTINVGNWLAVGRSNATGTVNMSGGTLNKLGGNGNHVTIGANTAASIGAFNHSGGIINSADSDFYVGESGTGTYDISGTAQANLLVLRMGVNASGSGTVNLNGGTINASQVVQGGGLSSLNFNGGTLRPVATSGDFITANVSANIQAGGAIIDTNGVDATINASLGAAVTPDGGLRKRGAGTLTLSGANSYTGPTIVEAGTLAVTGEISGSASITVQQNATLDTNPRGMVLANGQTLRGNGTVAGAIAMNGGSKLAPGEGIGTLAFTGNLDIALAVAPTSSSALLFDLGSTNDQALLNGGALTIGTGVLGFNDFSFTTSGGLTDGTYTLFDTSAPINGTLDSANLTGALGAFIGTVALGDGGRDVILVVVPEPISATILACGLGTLLGLGRIRRHTRIP